MAGKKTQIKKKKEIVLTPRNVEYVEEKTAAPVEAPTAERNITIRPSKQTRIKRIRRTGPATASTRPKSQQLPKPDAEPPAEDVNARTATPVDLDDPEMRASMESEPLAPPPEIEERERKRSRVDVEGEPTFKFFCYRCGQKLMVPVSWANQSYPCGRCGHDITIPPPLVGNKW